MRASIILFLVLSCAGCVSSAAYPTDWPQPAFTDTTCPNIFGTYADVGQLASTRGGDSVHPQSVLSRHFFKYDNREIAYTKISAIDTQSMRVESVEPGKEPLSRRLDRGEDFTCSDGRLWISEPMRIVDDGLSLRGRERIGFVTSENGLLIGESRIGARGRVFVVPVFVRERDYVLWELHASPAE